MNFYYLFKTANVSPFKSSDSFIINILKKNFTQITLYLNNKYRKIKPKSKVKKKKLRIYITESYNKNIRKWFLGTYLKDDFEIEYVEENPEYIIVDVFGYRNKIFKSNVSNAIKIGIFTENKIPDLSEFDYALGQCHLNYLDRYFKYLNLIYLNYKIIELNFVQQLYQI